MLASRTPVLFLRGSSATKSTCPSPKRLHPRAECPSRCPVVRVHEVVRTLPLSLWNSPKTGQCILSVLPTNRKFKSSTSYLLTPVDVPHHLIECSADSVTSLPCMLDRTLIALFSRRSVVQNPGPRCLSLTWSPITLALDGPELVIFEVFPSFISTHKCLQLRSRMPCSSRKSAPCPIPTLRKAGCWQPTPCRGISASLSMESSFTNQAPLPCDRDYL